MAIASYTLTCDSDYCDERYTDDEQVEDYLTVGAREKRATEAGWFIVRGPEREFGGDGVKTYCSSECMSADL